MMNDYIYKATSVFNNIQDSFDILAYEASVIDYVKCVLINKHDLEDFCVNGYDVSVNKNGDTYYLSSDYGTLRLNTSDGLIIDYNSE